MRKKVIDLGPDGREGIEAVWWDRDGFRFLWVNATDHPNDWKRHFQVGVAMFEIEGARRIVEIVSQGILKGFEGGFRVGGHSWGGALAETASVMLQDKGFRVSCESFGGKRAVWPFQACVRWRHRGDFVPWLPPWRKGFRQKVFGRFEVFWKAHREDRYRELMEKGGFC